MLVSCALACCRTTPFVLYRAYVYFTCPETFPPHWGAAVQLGPGTFQDVSRQGGFQDVSLREKTEILLKADGFCSVPPPPPPPMLIPGELTHTAASLKVLLPQCSHWLVSCIFQVTKSLPLE